MDQGEITESLKNISKILDEVKEHLRVINGRLGEGERWRAATETAMDTQIEGVDFLMDRTDEQQAFMNKAKGGSMALVQFVSTLVSAIGILIALAKITLFK